MSSPLNNLSLSHPTREQVETWNQVAAVHDKLIRMAIDQGETSKLVDDLEDSLLVDPSDYEQPPKMHIPPNVTTMTAESRSPVDSQTGNYWPKSVEYLIPIQDEVPQDTYEKICMDTLMKLENLNFFTVLGTRETPLGLKVFLKKNAPAPSSTDSSSGEQRKIKVLRKSRRDTSRSVSHTPVSKGKSSVKGIIHGIQCPIRLESYSGGPIVVNWKKIVPNFEEGFSGALQKFGYDTFLNWPDDKKVVGMLIIACPKNPTLRSLSRSYFQF